MSAPASSVPIVSLTSHLDDRASPLSRFLDHAFPRLDDVAAEALAQMPRTLRAAPDQGFHMPWTTIGTAIDHRLRLAFTPRALPGASRDAGRLVQPDHHRHPARCRQRGSPRCLGRRTGLPG